jgi:predicted transcriptional regulator
MNKREKLRVVVPTMSIESVRDTLRAVYSIKKPVSAKDLYTLAGLSQQNASTCLGIALSLGFVVEAEGRGVYELTDDGKNFVRFLEFAKEEKAKALVRNAILQKNDWAETVSFLRINKGKTRKYSDLVLYVESKADKQLTKEVRRKVAGALRSILIYSQLIEDNPDELVSRIGIVQEIEKAPARLAIPSSQIADQESESAGETIVIDSSEPAVFSIPGKFALQVNNNRNAIGEIRRQIRDGTSLAAWLDTILENLEKEKE